MMRPDKQDRIFVAGHGGMVGSAIVRALREAGYTDLITATRAELDLRNAPAVDRFFQHGQPRVESLSSQVSAPGGIRHALSAIHRPLCRPAHEPVVIVQ